MSISPGSRASRGGFFLNVVPAMLYVLAVFYGGSMSPSNLPSALPSDKLIHLIGFAGMQVVWLRAVRHEFPEIGLKQQLLWAAGIASGLGGVLELYQAAVPQRSPELLDWVADTVGALLAAAILYAFMRGPRIVPPSEELSERKSRPAQG